MKRKVVYNAGYGGYSFSPLAIKKFYELEYPNTPIYIYKREPSDSHSSHYILIDNIEEYSGSITAMNVVCLNKYFGNEFTIKYYDRVSESSEMDLIRRFNSSMIHTDLPNVQRHNENLVKVVEELGDKANSSISNLKIYDVGESAYHIDEYDGLESILTSDEWH